MSNESKGERTGGFTGYKGKPEIQKYGSLWLAFALMVCGFVPGLVYWILGTGLRYICPKCKMHLGKA